jgi:hypothetical protein
MRNEFTAIIEWDGDSFIAQDPESGSKWSRPDRREAKSDLVAAKELVLQRSS